MSETNASSSSQPSIPTPTTWKRFQLYASMVQKVELSFAGDDAEPGELSSLLRSSGSLRSAGDLSPRLIHLRCFAKSPEDLQSALLLITSSLHLLHVVIHNSTPDPQWDVALGFVHLKLQEQKSKLTTLILLGMPAAEPLFKGGTALTGYRAVPEIVVRGRDAFGTADLCCPLSAAYSTGLEIAQLRG